MKAIRASMLPEPAPTPGGPADVGFFTDDALIGVERCAGILHFERRVVGEEFACKFNAVFCKNGGG